MIAGTTPFKDKLGQQVANSKLTISAEPVSPQMADGYFVTEMCIRDRGRAIKDTTISGVAFDVLQNVTMISDEMKWSCAGMCGKKQVIPVGMGGPAIKTKINIGGR